MDIWTREILGNPVADYAVFGLLVAASVVVAMIARAVARRYLTAWAKHTTTSLDDEVVARVLPPLAWMVVLAGVAMAKEGLVMPGGVALWVDRALAVAGLAILFVAAMRLFGALVESLSTAYLERTTRDKDESERLQAEAAAGRVKRQVKEIGNMVFLILAVLTVLSNLGVDVKAIWASLGIGGIAIVVAVKDPLTNVVGRMYIFSTGIFDEGHFIKFEGWSGTVKRIGVFRTSIELFSDMTTVTIPNASFITKPVQNYFGRTKFMYKWDLDVPYDVDPDKVAELVEALKELILAKPEVNPASTWIYLDRLGSHSKVVRVWFQAGLADWGTSLHYGSAMLGDIQQLFARLGVEFAFPTSTVHLEPGSAPLFGPAETAS